MSENAVVPLEPKVPKPSLRAGGGLGAIVPQDAEQAYRMAQLIIASGTAPRDMDKPEKVVTAIFHGLEVGLKPMQAVQSIAVVNGRPCIWGDAALGLAMGSGQVEDIEEHIEGEGEKMVALCRVKRRDRATATVRTFSVDDAKAAGLWGKTGPWKQYTRRMLQMRARSWALRDSFPDVLKGLAVVEEVRDFNSPIEHGRESKASAIQAALSPPTESAKAPPSEPTADAGHGSAPDAAPSAPANPASTEPMAGDAQSFDGEAAYNRILGKLASFSMVKPCQNMLATDPDLASLKKHDDALFTMACERIKGRIEELRGAQ